MYVATASACLMARETGREYIVHPGAVMIVPLLDKGRLLMERQFRHPMGRVMLEFPAGKLDPNESPLACAKRELLEETRLHGQGMGACRCPAQRDRLFHRRHRDLLRPRPDPG